MVKLGLIQTVTYSNNKIGIDKVSKLIEILGKKEVDVICLPEQWLTVNKILNFDEEFSKFKKLSKNYSLTIIPGAFYEQKPKNFVISAPVIGPSGEIIGTQEKIHPYDYEKNIVKEGSKAKVFKTKCKFGIIICYDMVFPEVAKSLVSKGAEILISPSRIVKRGIYPWHLYTQVRALENRIPIVAANVQNKKFGGQSIIVDLIEKNQVMLPKIVAKLSGQKTATHSFNLLKYKKSRKIRYSDIRRFS